MRGAKLGERKRREPMRDTAELAANGFARHFEIPPCEGFCHADRHGNGDVFLPAFKRAHVALVELALIDESFKRIHLFQGVLTPNT